MPVAEAAPEVDLLQIADEEMGEGGLYVYESSKLEFVASSLLKLQMPYGLLVRYAAKANSHPQIVAQFDEMGLHFDASSANEAYRLLSYGVPGEKISLSSQVLRENRQLEDLLKYGTQPVATSLRQISMLGEMGCKFIAVRINPGAGSGHNNRTNVGGSASSFGIWHEQLERVVKTAEQAGVIINRLHTHIGSGADPNSWPKAIEKSLSIVEQLPDVVILDIGGGYKVGRMKNEKSTDMQQVAAIFSRGLEQFAYKTGREIKLEIEPGTYLVANAGTLLGRVEEIVKTDMYKFLKLNVGMNGLLRPSHYGAQHPIEVLSHHRKNRRTKYAAYVVVGPACESGDILTPKPDDPEGIKPCKLRKAQIGDIVAIGGAGAYGRGLGAIDYVDIPPPTELVV
jgi:diaminopimelate decarboxylase